MNWRRTQILWLIICLAGGLVAILILKREAEVHGDTATRVVVRAWVTAPGAGINQSAREVSSMRAMGDSAALCLVSEIRRGAGWRGWLAYSNLFVHLPVSISQKLPSPIDSRPVRARAYLTLAALGSDAAAAAPFLTQEVLRANEWCNLAGNALGEIGPLASNSTPSLIRALTTTTNRVLRFNAATALAGVAPGNDVFVTQMLLDLKSPDVVARRGAAHILGKSRTTIRLGEAGFTAALRDDDLWVRLYAGKALLKAGITNHEPVKVVSEAINDPTMSSGALMSLYGIRPATAEITTVMLEMARKFAPRLNGPSYLDTYFEQFTSVDYTAVPALQSALADSIPGIRAKAARALGGIGPRAAAALPALREATKDSEEDVKVEASKAVAAIEGGN